MSVIIRLQNLPWSANALDIRQYFRGLSIPEGGVHIVGGEQGDAFIAFSTDEDARQAMMTDGGKIKEIKIKLLLSSRAEMQKVIEHARQQSVNLQNFMQMPAPVPVTTLLSQIPVTPVTVAPVVPAAPVTTEPVQQPPPVPVVVPDRRDSRENDKDKKDTDSVSSKDKRDRKERSRSRDRDRERKDRDRDRHRDRDRERDRRRRDRSRSRDRDRRRRDRRDRSRSRERSRSRDRERDSKRGSRDIKRDSVTPAKEDEKPNNKEQQNGDVVVVPHDSPNKVGWEMPSGPMIPNRPVPNMVRPPMTANLSMGSGDSYGYSGMPLRGRESWPPSRQPFSRNERVSGGGGGGGGFSMGSFADAEDYDPHPEMESRGGSFRGNYRGGMGEFRRGGFAPRPGPGSMMDRMAPAGELEDNRRGNAFPGDRRNQYRMEREQDFGRGERFVDQFGRDQINDRYPSRATAFPGDRFQRDRYQPPERSFDPRQQMTGTAIEVRNMPIETNYGDVRRFFQGLHITGNGLKLINDNHGNRVGIAYVRFLKREDKEEALKYNGSQFRGSIIEVLHLNDDIFDSAIDSYKPPEAEVEKKEPASPPFVCVSIKDLPPYVKETDIVKLFPDIPVEEIVMFRTKDDKKQLIAIAKFSKPEEAKKALHCNSKHTIGHKAVAVAPCAVEEFHQAKEDQKRMLEPQPQPEPQKPDIKEKTLQQDPRSHNVPEPQPPQNIQTDCILLKGLPVHANDRDILDFFSDVGLVPLRIHIMLDKFNKPTGDAFCEFSTMEEAARSCSKHNMPLGKQDVIVQPVLREDMNDALGLVSQLEVPMQPVGLTRLQHPRDFNNRSMGLLGMSPSGPLLGRMPLLGRHPGPMPPGGNQSQVSPVEGFGKPGCVVALENIPFRADVDEILEFFVDFEMNRENVIRRFNDKGMATGDARVSFASPSEAQRAVRELRFRKIRGRPIYLSLL